MEFDAARRVLEALEKEGVKPLMLYKMKKDTVRPKDRMDAEELRRRFKL